LIEIAIRLLERKDSMKWCQNSVKSNSVARGAEPAERPEVGVNLTEKWIRPKISTLAGPEMARTTALEE